MPNGPDPYTHDFIYRMGDGGQYIIGEIEFDKDKKVTYRIDKWSEPISQELMEDFTGFVRRLKERFDEYGNIKFVQIIEKGYVEP